MVALPSSLPDWASLPLIVGGALVVAGGIRLFSKPAPGRAASSAPAVTPKGPLEAAIQRCRTGLERDFSARLGCPVRTTWYGAVDIDPMHLVIWLILDRDRDRDRLKALPDFEAACRAALAASGYPAGAVAHAHFGAESEETVRRDWGGNWWHYFK